MYVGESPERAAQCRAFPFLAVCHIGGCRAERFTQLISYEIRHFVSQIGLASQVIEPGTLFLVDQRMSRQWSLHAR